MTAKKARPAILHLDPRYRRQFHSDGVVAFWRGSPGCLEAYVAGLSACGTFECTDRHVLASGHVVGPEVRSVRATEDSLTYEYEPGSAPRGRNAPRTELITIEIDCETGVVSSEYEAPRDILDWLQGEMDGEMLDFLDRFRMNRKGLSPDEEWGAEWLEHAAPGELFPYPAAFPLCRRDVFIIGSRRFLATEHYDIEERAEGPVVHIAISELGDSQGAEFLGVFVVHVPSDLPDCPATLLEQLRHEVTETRHAAILRDVYTAYAGRHPDASRLRQRHEAMKAAIPRLVAAARARTEARSSPAALPSVRVGRNDRCPCGSGKKFKKCCLGAPATGKGGAGAAVASR